MARTRECIHCKGTGRCTKGRRRFQMRKKTGGKGTEQWVIWNCSLCGHAEYRSGAYADEDNAPFCKVCRAKGYQVIR